MVTEAARRVPRSAVVALTLAVVVVLASLPLFVFPSISTPAQLRLAPVDAVVVLGGGPGDRLGAASVLLTTLREPPPTVVLSVQHGTPIVTCGTLPGHPRVPLRCLTPDPFTTAGEAAAIATMAAEEGWQRVVVVTSDFHVARSRMLMRACVEQLDAPVDVLWAAAETDATSLHGLYAIITEWPSLLATPWDHEPSCRSTTGPS